MLLTRSLSAPILDIAACSLPLTSLWTTLPNVPAGWAGQTSGARAKERGVGAEQDDAYAARRTELDRQFRALPPTSSPAYWAAVETDVAAEALPLEVLVRCFRERWTAGDRDAANRVYSAVIGRIQSAVGIWANRVAHYAPADRVMSLAQELEQECYVAVWRELWEREDTFLAERFKFKLERIEQHTAHLVMEREGYWRRSGVQSPTRVPRSGTDRLEAARGDEERTPLKERLYDPLSDEAFERVELESDIRALLGILAPEDSALLYDRYWGDLTTGEIANRLGVTDRTVRNHLTRIYAELHRLIRESQEDANG